MSYYTDIGSTKDAAVNVASVALRVADDPALPQIVTLIGEVNALPSSGSPSPTERGIGLSKVVGPLRGFVAYKKHPWILPALVGGLVLGIFSFGVATGRRRRHV